MLATTLLHSISSSNTANRISCKMLNKSDINESVVHEMYYLITSFACVIATLLLNLTNTNTISLHNYTTSLPLLLHTLSEPARLLKRSNSHHQHNVGLDIETEH